MIYSVFNWRTGQYDYFQNAQASEVAPMPTKHKARKNTPIGVAPNHILPVLPGDAKPAGSGDVARGTLASLGGTDVGSSAVGVFIVIGAVLFIGRELFKGR